MISPLVGAIAWWLAIVIALLSIGYVFGWAARSIKRDGELERERSNRRLAEQQAREIEAERTAEKFERIVRRETWS